MINIISIKLQRSTQIHMFEPNTINGLLKVYYKEDNLLKALIFKTIENKQYTFPPGHYFIELQYSPKFKQNLWEFTDIDNRTEIKIHQGTNATQSKGCIILSSKNLHHFNKLLENTKLQTIKVS